MKKMLTRIGIIEYCKNCAHVSHNGQSTICGLTKSVAQFDYECNEFTLVKEKPKKKGFFHTWKYAALMSVLAFLRWATKTHYPNFDYIGAIFFVLGICWLLLALFSRRK